MLIYSLSKTGNYLGILGLIFSSGFFFFIVPDERNKRIKRKSTGYSEKAPSFSGGVVVLGGALATALRATLSKAWPLWIIRCSTFVFPLLLSSPTLANHNTSTLPSLSSAPSGGEGAEKTKSFI